jgi:hypothetical protein
MTTNKRAVERAARGLPEPPKCKAHKKDGSPCGRWPVKGATVCPKHGGAAPQVRQKAQERLLAATDQLMAALLRIAMSAESEAVRLAAIKDALDRAGFGAAQLHKLAVASPWDDLLQEIIMDGDIIVDLPAGQLPAARSGGGVFQDDDDEDDDTPAVREPTGGSRFQTPDTIPGKVVRDYPAPTAEQAAAIARQRPRMVAAFREEMGWEADPRYTERTEYGGDDRHSADGDPTAPPRYVREAMESEGKDWRTGQRSNTRWSG